MAIDFGPLAPRYDELRPAPGGALLDALVRLGDLRGRRVLDVGCGTGRLAAALATEHACKVWGVDPTPEMLAVARGRAPRGVGLKEGRAEDLPFRDAWFERATMTLVAHLLERPRAFAEVARVLGPGGRLALATFEPAHFAGYWLNGLFPSLERVDRERFPDEATLRRELAGAGLGAVETERVDVEHELGREEALARIRGRHISTFQLLSDDEYAEGLARAERELPGRIAAPQRWLVLAAVRPLG